MDNKLIDNNYNIDSLFDNIKDMVINSRNRVYSAVNTEMLTILEYWQSNTWKFNKEMNVQHMEKLVAKSYLKD